MRLETLKKALTENEAATDPESPDPALRGRTYAIPFDRVWNGVIRLAHGGLRGWDVIRADDEEGVIEAEATTRVLRFVDDVEIRIRLDPNAQTRVDMTSASRKGKADLGTNRRRIRSFLRELDREIEARPDEILDPETSVRRMG